MQVDWSKEQLRSVSCYCGGHDEAATSDLLSENSSPKESRHTSQDEQSDENKSDAKPVKKTSEAKPIREARPNELPTDLQSENVALHAELAALKAQQENAALRAEVEALRAKVPGADPKAHTSEPVPEKVAGMQAARRLVVSAEPNPPHSHDNPNPPHTHDSQVAHVVKTGREDVEN